MDETFRTLYRIADSCGIDLRKLVTALRNSGWFVSNWRSYQRQNDLPQFAIQLARLFPVLGDYNATAGSARGHYFHQDLWAARKIFQAQPARHVDIGSRIDGFVSHLLVFMPVEVIDIRPLSSTVRGLQFVAADATRLDSFADRSVASLSSLHAAEHFGLGRYGDPVDPHACFLFMSALQRVLAVGGRLYFSVPVGRERLEFNAHRIFAPETILKQFSELRLMSFSYISDDGNLHEDSSPTAVGEARFGCGLFEFTR